MTTSEMFGPYRLDSLLGRGGMGEVHLAFDTEHQRTVALKTLAPHLADDEEFQSRFRREARHVAKLRNPHVIPIHRYGEIEGQLFIDMRYVEGPDLSELVRSGGRVEPGRAVAFVEQVASALDAAHSSGLVHRDVKPANVLVDATVAEFVYLVDFGITRSATTQRSYSLTRTGAVLGSLDYMAPEQFDGAVSIRSDVYGLTCILFELLTGVKPYHGEGLAALMHAHLSTPPPSPSDRDADLGAFDDVVARGMAKSAEQRYPTAGGLAAAARTALTGRTGGPDGVVRVQLSAVPPVDGDGPPTAGPESVDADEPEEAASRHAPAPPPTMPEPQATEAAEPGQSPGPPPAAGPPHSTRTSPISDEAVTGPVFAGPRPEGTGTAPQRAEPAPPPRAGLPPAGRPPGCPPAPNRPEPPPGPGGARNTRTTLLALLIATLALVAVAGAGVIATSAGQVEAPAEGPPTAQPTIAPATPSVGPDPGSAAVRQATFTGHTDDGTAITIVVGDRAAMAYLCDGSDIEAWLRGEILPNNTVQLDNNRSGAMLDAALTSDEAEVLFTDSSGPHRFDIARSTGNTGLYEAAAVIDGRPNRIGWVVQSDGSQTGIRTQGDEILPAPPLDTEQLTTTIDGQTIQVRRHTGDGEFVGG